MARGTGTDEDTRIERRERERDGLGVAVAKEGNGDIEAEVRIGIERGSIVENAEGTLMDLEEAVHLSYGIRVEGEIEILIDDDASMHSFEFSDGVLVM